MTICTTWLQDKHYRRYLVFLACFLLLLLVLGTTLCTALTAHAKTILLFHDKVIVTSLLNQGISEQAIAAALTDTPAGDISDGASLLARIGISKTQETRFLPPLYEYAKTTWPLVLSAVLLLSFLLFGGTCLFLSKRDRLYRLASSILNDYLDGDYSRHLPQCREGNIYHMFSCIDRFAAMQQARNEQEHHSKIFLQNTISDISHQLKTPLAALSMYQEIMENEPDHPDIIQKFTAKAGTSIKRMEQLIQSLLKLTRLDAGTILFEKKTCNLAQLVSQSLHDLTTRAVNEGKRIVEEGSPNETLICDPVWTKEAVGNIVKNALDHTQKGGIIRISWKTSPAATSITIFDNGSGIAPEDIYHIFKRFYRSHNSKDTQGIGLGLPLAKSIVEGQGGTITVRSAPGAGTEFTLMF